MDKEKEDSQGPSKDDPMTHPMSRSRSSLIYSLSNPVGAGPSERPLGHNTFIQNVKKAKLRHDKDLMVKALDGMTLSDPSAPGSSSSSRVQDPNETGALLISGHQQVHSSSYNPNKLGLDVKSPLSVKSPTIYFGTLDSGIKREDVLLGAASGTEDVGVIQQQELQTRPQAEEPRQQEPPPPAFDLADESQFPELPKRTGRLAFLANPPPPPRNDRQEPARGGRGYRGLGRF